MKSLRGLILLSACCFTSPAVCFSQDQLLRVEAIALLERAHAVSVSPNLPNLERVDTFRVFDPNATAREGSFTRVVVQGAGRREETVFGDYHVISVWTGNSLHTTRTNQPIPREIDTLMRIAPVYLISFDQTDVIRAITSKELGGHSLRCVEFDTVTGRKSESNQACVDAGNGTLVSAGLGDDLIENSDFFPFAGALLPAKITYSVRGALTMEITQTMTQLTDTGISVLTAPPDARTLVRCTTYRRAIGQSMPQPQEGSGGRDVDVVLRGIIGEDGKVHGALVQESERPDLDAEALRLIGQWVFLPAMCNGHPNSGEASFVLHFHGR